MRQFVKRLTDVSASRPSDLLEGRNFATTMYQTNDSSQVTNSRKGVFVRILLLCNQTSFWIYHLP